jgi:hypothetical protein
VNIDLASTFNFGDVPALRQFFLDHYTVHIQTAQALGTTYGGIFSTTGLFDQLAEDAWVEVMSQRTPASRPLAYWLILHNQIHQTTEQQIVSAGLNAPDLSIVDFSKEDQFYDWMYVHQEMHDYEQQALGLL